MKYARCWKTRSGLQSAAQNPAPVTPPAPPIQPPPTVQTAPAAPQPPQLSTSPFSDTDNSPFHDLYNGAQYYAKQKLTPAQLQAMDRYLQVTPESGTLYSPSQNMNWLMLQNANKGLPPTTGMNPNQLAMYQNMMSAMHNLGYNVNLSRYDHAGFVNNLLAQSGFNGDFTQMTPAQLSAALVGRTYGEERMVSTSYNNFKNAPQSSKNVFMNRAVRIEYKAKAGTQAVMPGNGPGGQLGEVVLAPSMGKQNYRIVGVSYDNNVRVRQKGTSWLSNQRQLVLTVEVG